MERIVILAEQDVDYISTEFLPPELRSGGFDTTTLTSTDQTSQKMKTMKDAYEKEMLLKALQKHNWNQSSAAKELGVHEKTVRNKMKKFHIKKL